MKLLIGISGGIDSTVSALKLKEEGFDLIGIHLNILNTNTESANLSRVQEILKIEIYQPEVSGRFTETVIQYFRKEHLKGRSPSPCGKCNPLFKWKIMEEEANKWECDGLATGHYINKELLNNKWLLKKGVDETKDQSYFLWGLNSQIIKKIYTPLGNQLKEDTYKYAKNKKLDFLIQKAESTGLCFSGSLNYPELIEKYIPEIKNIPQGDIVNTKGVKTGYHKGYIYYTIGQKKDLYLAQSNGECVIGINPSQNIVIAGDPQELWKYAFTIEETEFIDIDFALKCTKLTVNIRGFGWNPKGYCKLEAIDCNKYSVKLTDAAWAPAPGQPAVFYYKDYLLGGGIITN